ncbi:MAG: outer membrane lipid asymmetry maintenance protein MlaD [Desulfobacterales bacterium]|nr:MAG: outer membrane lipid asymmetry maintenance protein MlaD [Desulfobacterales bacterium]
MNKRQVELGVGIFVLIGLIGVGYLTIRLGKMEWIGGDYYTVSARFQSVAGLKSGAEVVISGVKVGNVSRVELDQENMEALVRMKIRRGIVLSEDAIASVKTSGLIGDKYIRLSPGGSDTIIKPGELITETESAIDLEDMISKYVFGGV